MNVKPAKLIEELNENDDRRQSYYFGAKESYYCKKDSGWCESKVLKVGDTESLKNLVTNVRRMVVKQGKGTCLEANFEKSKAYPKVVIVIGMDLNGMDGVRDIGQYRNVLIFALKIEL